MFFGRCSVMAKALGSTPEEEHKVGLHRIANVGDKTFLQVPFVLMNTVRNIATPRPSGSLLHRLGAIGGHRLVRRLQSARLWSQRKYCISGRNSPRRTRTATSLRSPGTYGSQRRATASQARLTHQDGSRCPDIRSTTPYLHERQTFDE